MAASEFMREALSEAALAQGTTAPNPPVGAVVVSEGEIVGRGYTQPPGGDHAEVGALREAGERARGATVYVTLEPCSHTGRTPPCSDALIAAGVEEVRYAIEDPDSHVAGNGGQALREAGIEASEGDGAEEASYQLAGYLKHRRTGLPLVVVKFAASLDGRIAASSGDSRWVSGSETLAWAHEQRPALDAIVVGSNTVVIDDPQLTARPGGSSEGAHQPLRIVLDSRGRTPEDATVLGGESSTLIATTEASTVEWRELMAARGAELLVLPQAGGHLDLGALLRELGERGMLTVLFEGGGVVLGSLFDRRLVDRVHAVIAPVVIGARDAPSAVAGEGVERMAQAPRLRDVTVERLSDDTLISGVPVWPDADADNVMER
ncbi:MAG TPA: bifunctional diaminohydroxyphosphoribosylaminopyrimidine deaminase/5-amino-6-(5-phosphoribosylamino)uracil reductase RibD [Dehalococcoidia bacterium]|nr:bifunctional diaminohydroxyphosphoribosylaminopyrimidine deaminase/5-amino-6-(5-phosphoribosylamino)uracil reductase RibD [Dehalococcoidia bacterium]